MDILSIINIGTKILDRVLPDPAQKAEAQQKLAELAQSGKLASIEADLREAQMITDRHAADMASDSWLSKNIRPMCLIAILGAYFGLSIASIFGFDTKESYVSLLGEWGIVVMSFYFGGRTIEKGVQKWKAMR